tara:strand:+ start:8 stop:847 length:840 start_codon:yes stop_codon:yes gene_type:complete
MDCLFPLKKVNIKRAVEDYFCLRTEPTDRMTMRQVGNKATDYFFDSHRAKVRVSYMSAWEAWHTPEQKEKLEEAAMKLYKTIDLTPAKWRAVLNMRHGAVSQFKPNIARFLFAFCYPTCILDPCAGWGGRLLGAMSLDIDYIGIDTNTDLEENYKELIKMYPSGSKIQMYFQDALTMDYSALEYDMVFTSPPYCGREKYNKMPKYRNYEEQLIKPLVEKTYKGLSAAGIFAMNVPDYIYLWIKKILGECHYKMPLLKAKRPPNARGADYKEYIYLWKKE